MGQDSKIEWTDHTFNPWWGCTHVHEGCRHCYAETWAKRFGVEWGPAGVRRVASEKQWAEPLKWNRLAEKAGVRAKVFCASMADVFEDWSGRIIDTMQVEMVVCHGCNKMTPSNMDCQGASSQCGRVPRPATMDDVRKRLFALIDQTPWLDWQLVTKRPENILRMTPPYEYHACETGDCPHELASECCSVDERKYRDNVWLLTSISNQASATKQIPELLKCHDLSPVLGLSCEPLLGPIDLARVGNHDGTCANPFDGNCLYVGDIGGAEYAWSPRNMLRWVIVGGESGPGSRPMHPDWARSLRDQCQAAKVPFFFKQFGEFEYVAIDKQAHVSALLHDGTETAFSMPDERDPEIRQLFPDGWREVEKVPDGAIGFCRVGKAKAGRILDGRTWDEFPEVSNANN